MINCKVDLKLNWTKYCVLSVAGNGNDINVKDNANNIIFTIKDTKVNVVVVMLLAKDNERLSNLLTRKRFERSLYCNKYQRKKLNKNTTNEFRFFLESNLLDSVDRLF